MVYKKPNQMPPRNTRLSTTRQRSKSLPSRNAKQPLLFSSKSNTSSKQQLRMVSFHSSKNQQASKSQTDIPAVLKVLDEFEHILKNLQMTNSDISDLNVLMKELRDCISHFPRFLSVDPKQRDIFFQHWANITSQALIKLNSGRPHSYETAFQQLREARENIEQIQTKSKQGNTFLSNLFMSFDNIQNNINELIQKKSTYDQKTLHEHVAKIKSDLLKLQSAAPTTKSNQDIARVLLEFNKIEKKERSQQILNFNIQKAEKQLQALIQVKPQIEQAPAKKEKQAESVVSTNRKRPKSVGGFDAKSRVSSTSQLSSKSLASKQLKDYDKKIGGIKSKSLILNHEINSLSMKISRIQKSINNCKAHLNQITEINSLERDTYKKKVADKIKESGAPGCENYEQKEKQLAIEQKNNFDLEQRRKEIDIEEHERLELEHKIRETEQWQTQIDQELIRAKNLYDCLKDLTSDEKINFQNPNENGGIEINYDNKELLKEKEDFETQLKKKETSVSKWSDSWRNSVGANLINDLDDKLPSDIQQMFRRSEIDHQYMINWKKELDDQIDQLRKEADYFGQSGDDLDIDNLTRLKEAIDNLNFYHSAITNPQNKEKIPVSKQIQINKMEIDRLSKFENETKSESQEVAEQRNQNLQMIQWAKDLIDQIQSAMTSQNGLKAQLDKTKNMEVFDFNNDDEAPKQIRNDDQRKEKLDQEINELSNAIFSRDKLKSEYEDYNTNMQQVYENIFYVQTNETFLQLCPQVKDRIRKLIEYHRLKRKYNHMLNPDAEDSDIDIDFDMDYDNDNDESNPYDTDNMYNNYNSRDKNDINNMNNDHDDYDNKYGDEEDKDDYE